MNGDRWGRESKYVVYVSRKVRVVFIVETGRKNDWMDRKECSGKRVYKKKNGQERERRGAPARSIHGEGDPKGYRASVKRGVSGCHFRSVRHPSDIGEVGWGNLNAEGYSQFLRGRG